MPIRGRDPSSALEPAFVQLVADAAAAAGIGVQRRRQGRRLAEAAGRVAVQLADLERAGTFAAEDVGAGEAVPARRRYREHQLLRLRQSKEVVAAGALLRR